MNPTLPSVTQTSTANKVVVATTVALTFITFWQAAAIVLSDLASTMYYIGGITEQAIGKSAPWMVLGVMLFSYAVRSVYMESCGMFVRGGVYVVVRDSIGPTVAKLSVSSLVVDYILTGPISAVSAGQYLGHLVNDIAESLHLKPWLGDVNWFSVFFSVMVTIYFWWSNIKGVPESGHKALRIMQITTVMVAILLVWAPLTLVLRGGAPLPPLPTPSNIHLTKESLGWLYGTWFAQVSFVVIIVSIGHSLLAMSGFETLAQVYREVGYPKLKNLRITANIVCTYAVICTGVISVLAVMIIPDSTRASFYDNMIGGLVMNLAGPEVLKLGFHVFVVVVGVLILAGAVNTSLIGVNGVLNRVAEDGVLLDWFRKPQAKFGTTYRILTLMAGLQIITIIASRGDVFLLGEAYAFGVVWSFFLKSLGVLVLRYQRHNQEYKFPFNFTFLGREIPVGLGADHADSVPGRHRESLLEEDRHHLRRLVYDRALRSVHDFGAGERQQEKRRALRPGEVQPGSSDGSRCGHLESPAWLRAGGRARQPPPVASGKSSGEDQHAPPRHCGDDGAAALHRRRRIPASRRSGICGL